ncbi:transcriptional regulator, AraC family [Chitinophaga jiangningensis]|uniref:Transcriptional regulator, AraC family n=1 Tax=Chitinophaga jiangningensis TaxID=1419482 RepID=A0A1M7MWM0_9BACT|nr:helix-turn-helix transcriptional regulator [Chitinophaga jiangningensis]SHM95569.1 transcriptional regulator, AraC family [Chitinophaga jiangningensis]
MEFLHQLPCPQLQPYVSNYLLIRSGEGRVNTVLPGPGITLSFRITGNIQHTRHDQVQTLGNYGISGIRKEAQHMNYHPDTTWFLITFKPGRAAAFIQAPLHEVNSQVVSLDNFFPDAMLRDLSDRLQAAPTPAAMVAITDQWLLRLQPSALDPLVQAAIEKIQQRRGQLRMTELASALYTSKDPLEKRFRAIVGATPKQYATIVKLNHIIHQQPTQSLTSLAYDAGYFDQSHFIKDFRRFTGTTPHDFFSRKQEW